MCPYISECTCLWVTQSSPGSMKRSVHVDSERGAGGGWFYFDIFIPLEYSPYDCIIFSKNKYSINFKKIGAMTTKGESICAFLCKVFFFNF